LTIVDKKLDDWNISYPYKRLNKSNNFMKNIDINYLSELNEFKIDYFFIKKSLFNRNIDFFTQKYFNLINEDF
jgi:hypothetical protein